MYDHPCTIDIQYFTICVYNNYVLNWITHRSVFESLMFRAAETQKNRRPRFRESRWKEKCSHSTWNVSIILIINERHGLICMCICINIRAIITERWLSLKKQLLWSNTGLITQTCSWTIYTISNENQVSILLFYIPQKPNWLFSLVWINSCW